MTCWTCGAAKGEAQNVRALTLEVSTLVDHGKSNGPPEGWWRETWEFVGYEKTNDGPYYESVWTAPDGTHRLAYQPLSGSSLRENPLQRGERVRVDRLIRPKDAPVGWIGQSRLVGRVTA